MPDIQKSGYTLGSRSRRKLEGVHPVLVRVVERAIQISGCDFTVLEGVRQLKRQRQLLKAGKSKTLNSRHLPKTPLNAPELGEVSHAVDLGAWVDNELSWTWSHYFKIADAMKQAAEEEGAALKWGGCWALLSEYDSAKAAYDAYLERKRAKGKKPYTDGPHFELSWEVYPV